MRIGRGGDVGIDLSMRIRSRPGYVLMIDIGLNDIDIHFFIYCVVGYGYFVAPGIDVLELKINTDLCVK